MLQGDGDAHAGSPVRLRHACAHRAMRGRARHAVRGTRCIVAFRRDLCARTTSRFADSRRAAASRVRSTRTGSTHVDVTA
ncbi:hypothetical protein CVS37_21055 [Burkholderia lata]|nr:hypothetical protein CVS37_21055 [Burkholderia lata]